MSRGTRVSLHGGLRCQEQSTTRTVLAQNFEVRERREILANIDPSRCARDSRLHAKPTRTNRRFNNGNCHSVLTLAHAWSCARTEPDLRLTGNNMQLSISRRITRSGFAERQIAPGDFVEEYRPELCKAHARRYGETQVRLTHLANQDGACGPILKSGDIFAKTPGMRREHGCASAGGSCFR